MPSLTEALTGVMSSFLSNKKSCKGLKVWQHEDRITNLPSCLITKILSCLPTKEAVATSVLSTKWKLSWIYVTNLDFHDELKYPYEDLDPTICRKLSNFVDRVLLLRGRSLLQRFRLKCCRVYDDSLVNEWIISILQCNVEELDISIYLSPCVLPSDIFLCSTLVILKLNARESHVTVPTSSSLPNLRTLHLTKVLLPNDASIRSLLSGCPMLEELSLSLCIGKDVRAVNISARVLKSLKIKTLPYGVDQVIDYQIVIDTPALENLDFADCSLKVCVLNKMANFIRATIDISAGPGIFEDEFQEEISGEVENLLNSLFQVKNLTLTSDMMEIISWCNLAFPTFSNITCLRLHTEGNTGWIVSSKLIENSPCLETLYINQGDKYDIDEELDIFPFHDVPSCFDSQLKKIEIENFWYSETEMEIVEYFLKNAKVLEKLTLWCEPLNAETAEVHKWFFMELISFPRDSSTCKIEVLCSK